MNTWVLEEVLEENQGGPTIEAQTNGEGRKFEATALGKLREEVNKTFDNFDVFKNVKSLQVIPFDDTVLANVRKSDYWNEFLELNNYYHHNEQGVQKQPAINEFMVVIPSTLFWRVMFGYVGSIPPALLEKLLAKMKLNNDQYAPCTLDNTWFIFEDKYKTISPPQ